MTREEADFIGAMNMCDEISNEAYKKIMCHCEEQQPCEDAVSRQTVLQCIKESRDGIDWGQSEDEDAFLHYTAALYRTIASKECFPSVQPKPKMGEWVNMGNHEVNRNIYIFKCSNCHKKMMIPLSERLMYCPNCGSYNGGGEDAK